MRIDARGSSVVRGLLRYALPAVGLMLIAACGAAQAATYTWKLTGGGSWALATNWNPTRSAPATDDHLVFDGAVTTHIAGISGVSTQSIGQLELRNGASIDLSFSTPSTLTLTGLAGTDLVLPAGVSLDCSNVALELASGATGLVSGTLSLHNDGQCVATDAASLVVASGGVIQYGPSSVAPFGETSLNSVVFEPGATFEWGPGDESPDPDPFGAAPPNSVMKFETGSTFKISGHVNTSAFSGRTIADLVVKLLNSGAISLINGPLPFTVDNLTVSVGQLSLRLSDVHIHGDVLVDSGRLQFDVALAQTIALDGTAPQTLTGGWTWQSYPLPSLIEVVNPTGVTMTQGSWNQPVSIAAGAKLIIGHLAGVVNPGAFDVHGTLQFAEQYAFAGPLPVYFPGSSLVFDNADSIGVGGKLWPEDASGPSTIVIQGGGRIAFEDTDTHSVPGVLALVNGIADMGGGVMQIEPGGSVTGGNPSSYVRGRLQKTPAAPGSCAFEIGDRGYAPLTLMFSDFPSGSLVASTTFGDHPSIALSDLDRFRTVNRFWSVEYDGMIVEPVSATFQFNAVDVDPAAHPAEFVVRKFDGPSTWTPLATTAHTSTTVSVAGITGFSDFQIGNTTNPAETPATALPRRMRLTVIHNPIVASGPLELSIDVPTARWVDVDLLDSQGRRVDSIIHGDLAAGVARRRRPVPQGTPAGVYFVRMSWAGGSWSEKVILVR